MKHYDIIIIGGGPAGLTAGIYAARAGHRVLIAEKKVLGGQMGMAAEVANYPGFLTVSGFELTQKMAEQAESAGAEILYGTALDFDFVSNPKTLTAGGETISGTAVILAGGLSAKPLGLKGEPELLGNGVSYCAECDGAFFKNKTVVVYGAGNWAIKDAEYLKKLAGRLILVSGGTLSHVQIDSAEKIENAKIVKLSGNPLQAIELKDKDGVLKTVPTDGLFIAGGKAPDAAPFVKAGVAADQKGYIITDENMRTNIEGVFAAGDIRVSLLKQIVTACADGAAAAVSAAAFIKRQRN